MPGAPNLHPHGLSKLSVPIYLDDNLPSFFSSSATLPILVVVQLTRLDTVVGLEKVRAKRGLGRAESPPPFRPTCPDPPRPS